MQTSRHHVFATLALCAAACRPPAGHTTGTPSPAGSPDAVLTEPTADGDATRSPTAAPKRTLLVVRAPGPGSPRITTAHFASRFVLRLSFSEPVTVQEGFDPDQFRLSFGVSYRESEGEAMAYYYDPGLYEDTDGDPVHIDSIEADDDTVLLRLSEPIPAELCDAIEDIEQAAADGENAQGGLFLHYSNSPERPAIVDEEDNPLDDIAAQWVLRGASSATYYGANLKPLDPIGPISCPPEQP